MPASLVRPVRPGRPAAAARGDGRAREGADDDGEMVRGPALAFDGDLDLAVGFVHVGEEDGDARTGKDVLDAAGPFDRGDAAGVHPLEAAVEEERALAAFHVRVEVVEVEAALVGLEEGV